MTHTLTCTKHSHPIHTELLIYLILAPLLQKACMSSTPQHETFLLFAQNKIAQKGEDYRTCRTLQHSNQVRDDQAAVLLLVVGRESHHS